MTIGAGDRRVLKCGLSTVGETCIIKDLSLRAEESIDEAKESGFWDIEVPLELGFAGVRDWSTGGLVFGRGFTTITSPSIFSGEERMERDFRGFPLGFLPFCLTVADSFVVSEVSLFRFKVFGGGVSLKETS